MKLLVQISAAKGPAECELATRYTYEKFTQDAIAHKITINCLESTVTAHGYSSLLLEVEGEVLDTFLNHWIGTIQWTFQSPIRPQHRRKNWFVGIQSFHYTQDYSNDQGIMFQACRASGAGGQHVNTTDSAVHATHTASGISVKVMSERSQHANKRRAIELIHFKLAQLQQDQHAEQKQRLHGSHAALERGNPVQKFKLIRL